MRLNHIAMYILNDSDAHSSEYVNEYFKERKYFSGFTGSNGMLVVTLDEAYLFTDGRYFIQAEKELENSNIYLMRIGNPDVPSIHEFINMNLNDREIVGFNGSYFSYGFVEKLNYMRVNFNSNLDFTSLIWNDRKEINFNQVYSLPLNLTGLSRLDKLEIVKGFIFRKKADALIINSLDEIAWLFNLRGNDVLYNPVFYSYAIISFDNAYLYVNKNVVNDELLKELAHDKIIIKDYQDIYQGTENIKGKKILADFDKINYKLYERASENNSLINYNPIMLGKAIKNNTEIKNIKDVHVIDGVAITKFMYYLKTNFNKIPLNEYDLGLYLSNLRASNKEYIEDSFNTICAFKENAAIMHYSATKESCKEVLGNGLLLVDSGGQYFGGTTDITRTFVLGKADERTKHYYTSVLRAMIKLSKTSFLYGANGQNLDILAREVLWSELLDYKSGTGHGIGYMLNVHEAPNGFRWKKVEERNDSAVLEKGMITSCEPGIYLENDLGIRIENELLTIEKGKNEYGTFMGFETITIAPIDLDGINPLELLDDELIYLNNYHQMVYEKLSPYLDENEKMFLKEYTKKLVKS